MKKIYEHYGFMFRYCTTKNFFTISEKVVKFFQKKESCDNQILFYFEPDDTFLMEFNTKEECDDFIEKYSIYIFPSFDIFNEEYKIYCDKFKTKEIDKDIIKCVECDLCEKEVISRGYYVCKCKESKKYNLVTNGEGSCEYAIKFNVFKDIK